jgi:hypothetical protein
MVAGAVALVLTCAESARADESTAARRAAAAHEMKRPFTMVELGLGFLTLPAAKICPRSLDDCERGETSLAAGIENLYRFHSIAFGAGILWATTLRSDTAAGAADLERDHSRRYFLVEAQFRYYGLETGPWEWWLGGTVGGVVVNDSWTVKADREPYEEAAYVGPRAMTIGTEGLATGIAIGGEWSFAANFSFGTMLRYSMWFLPEEPEVSPTGDFASLSGRVDMIDFGLVLAYRIAL